jgi:16S rRNA (adenine1518-N6/adenine1519-N6)-dimethyltransferase
MAQSKQEIQAILSSSGSTGPRHRFGQNFMIDQNLVRLVAGSAAPAAGDLVVEVGPGTGTLTDELLRSGADVTAVEIDRNLAAALREKFAGEPRFTLIEGDALAGKHELNGDLLTALRAAAGRGAKAKLIANLPYNIASPLVVELLIAGVDVLAFTVQREVADRLRANAGTEDYGPLTVMVQMLSRVEVLRTLPPQAFWPQPKIDSALVRLTRADRLGEKAGPFGAFVQKLFAARRKTVRKALTMAGYDHAEALLASVGVDGGLRPEVLGPGKLLELFDRCSAAPRTSSA